MAVDSIFTHVWHLQHIKKEMAFFQENFDVEAGEHKKKNFQSSLLQISVEHGSIVNFCLFTIVILLPLWLYEMWKTH